MDKAQAITLTRLVKAMCPAQQIDEYTPDAWYEGGLKNWGYDDAKNAVITLSTQLRFIALSDIAIEIKRVRRGRLEAAGPTVLAAGVDADDVSAYLVKHRADVKAIADGAAVPDFETHELRDVAGLLQSSGIGRRAIGGTP